MIKRYNLKLDQVCKENNLTEDEIYKLKEMLSKKKSIQSIVTIGCIFSGGEQNGSIR